MSHHMCGWCEHIGKIFNMALKLIINKKKNYLEQRITCCCELAPSLIADNNHTAVTANIIIIEELVNVINQSPNEACIVITLN